MMEDILTPGLLSQIAVSLVTAGAVYGGIRSDLKHIMSKLKDHDDSLVNANQRIDRMLERRAAPRT